MIRDWAASGGRSLVSLLVMLITFAVLGAIFIVLDANAGVRLHDAVLLGATGTPTPTPHEPATRLTASGTRPSAPASTASATASATATAAIGSATAVPTVSAPPTATAPTTSTTPAAVTVPATMTESPPYYGAQLNYPNNTAFTGQFLSALDERIITLTNGKRAAHGLLPVHENGQLDIIAAARSQDLIKRNYCDHFDPTSIDAQGHHVAAVQELLSRDGVPYTDVGENLVCNIGYQLDNSTPDQTVQAWMNHQEHRDNILGDYTDIGVGMAVTVETAGLRVVITQVFLR